MEYPIVRLLVQILVILLLAPLMNGIIRKIKATIQHRKGTPVLQLYYDLAKLFRKDVVLPQCSSWIFRVSPYVYFISVLSAFALIPAVPGLFSLGFAGDAILAVYLLAMGRFFITLSALDAGSTFGGMGASREMMISSLIEPTIIVTIFTLGLHPKVHSTALQAIYNGSAALGTELLKPTYLLLLAAMLIVLIAETARIPVDDPATHLELTMVHEAMILEYSGRYLALIQYASSLKQLLFSTLIVNLFLPFGSGPEGWLGLVLSLLVYTGKVLLVTVVVALIEINTVKLRLFSVPNLAALAFILTILGFMSGYILGR